MSVGRKPQPLAFKLLKAVPAQKRNDEEPQVQEALSTQPPVWMDDAQKKVWREILPQLPEGMLRSLDQQTFEAYCVSIAARDELILKLRDHPTRLLTTDKGNVIQHPYVGMLNKQIELSTKLGSELGFSPTSRARLKVQPTGKSKNPFADLAAKKRTA